LDIAFTEVVSMNATQYTKYLFGFVCC